MMNRKLKNRIVTLSMIPVLMFSACGKKSAQEAEENIELLDPVSVAASYVPAEYRDMYEYKVVSAVCSPALSECVMETSMTFQAYEKTPGEPVEKGEVLISGYTGDLDQRIEDQTKAIADMEENHADELEQRADSLEKTEKNYWKEMELLEDLKKAQPDKDSEDYEAWMAKHFNDFSSSEMAELNLKRVKQQNKESDELYVLDIARQQQILEELQRQKNNMMLLAKQ